MFPDKVFLASKSPRRLELLGSAFNNVYQITSQVEEPRWNDRESARDYLVRCMEAKTRGAREAYISGAEQKPVQKTISLAVAADTIVVLKNEIFGKPDSPLGAFKMLSTLMGQTHEVLTGYSLTLFSAQKPLQSYDEILSTKVTFGRPSAKELWNYVKSGEPMDKSGSYGVQGPALQFVRKVEGSYLSVMGLPIAVISKKAREWEKAYGKE